MKLPLQILTSSASRIKLLITESIKSWVSHRAGSKGAALAFYTLFSMTPVLLLVIAIAGHILGMETAQTQVLEKVRSVVGINGTEVIKALLLSSKNSQSGLFATIIASALMLVGATSVFVELKASLDEIWGIKNNTRSAFGDLLITRLLSFAIILILTVLLFMALILQTVLAVVEHYASEIISNSATFFATITSLLSFGIIACLFAVIFKMLPDAKLAWRDVWFGSVFTAGMFALGKYGIGLYLGSSGITTTFGAAGSVIALLLWIYYSAQIFFFGAEFTRQYVLCFGSLKNESNPA
jgi:membrane protein